ncbi:MAG: Mov34/MPN/PAD-1 family protein [Anaeromyxobacter sp.]|nr:Mov34/MPN/PAD-1 family protein [Anaeromyxobacter sp.]MBL0277791.1 Mov34/MPN/PAD-1 family protein [Anaeromyxobacter sp.]
MDRLPEEPLQAAVPRLVALAEAEPGREACGLVVALPGRPPEPWPFANAAPDPSRRFELAPRDLLTALTRLDELGGALLAIYHSHLSGGPGLSAADLDAALAGGQPLWPGVAQLVVALEQGRAVAVRCHRWAGASFEGRDLWRAPGGACVRDPPP